MELKEELQPTQNDYEVLQIIEEGFKILESFNNINSIRTLLQFVKPNLTLETNEIQDISESALSSIRNLILYSSEKFEYKQNYRSNSLPVGAELQKEIYWTMINGHLREVDSDFIVFCKCGLDSQIFPK